MSDATKQTVYNFCAGPAMLPVEVMKQAQEELVNWNNTGCSVMELSHRSSLFKSVAKQAEKDFRELLSVPDDYSVLFMHGGGRGQFSAVPMNLAGPGSSADYAITGSWSKASVAEAKKFLDVSVVTEPVTEDGIRQVADMADWQTNDQAAYLHYCPNETVDGVKVDEIPSGTVPLVADMSSNIMSKRINVKDYGVIYAGAQKNIGPSGLTMVVVNNALLGQARADTPAILNYTLAAENGSMFNTPPTFAWYLAGLVFKWLKAKGGVDAMATINEQKAQLLYQSIDSSDFYRNSIASENRSLMNVPFQLADSALDKTFLAEAEQCGLMSLAGHRSVGGMRASIYNAMPLEGVQALVSFMADFEKRYG